MKQLISQSRIDEAAKEYATTALPNSTRVMQNMIAEVYSTGVQFTLNEIQSLMIEFAEFAYKNYDYIERISNKNEWVWKKNNNCFTTQQILKEFINSKNKENE